MRIDVVTLFPEMVVHAAGFGVTGRARERRLWDLGVWNPRDFATDAYRTIDDRPYGGGPGMVMMAEPLARAIAAARAAHRDAGAPRSRTIHLSPAGVPLTHARIAALVAATDVAYVLVAGRYEGVDERLIAAEVDEELSVGDFVVSGGELPALMLIDAMVRHVPGALNDPASAEQESFVDGLLDCPHYTRPEMYAGVRVPEVLLSGNHAVIARWRHEQALRRTWLRRPDMLRGRAMTRQEQDWLAGFERERRAGAAPAPAGNEQ